MNNDFQLYRFSLSFKLCYKDLRSVANYNCTLLHLYHHGHEK